MQPIGRHGLVVVAALTLLCTGMAGTARAVGTAQIVVPSPLFSIQAAVNAAANGGIIVVGPGVYHEQIDFKGKSITVRSLNGPATTTLHGGQAGGVVSFHSGETAAAILAGFTITGGIDSGIQVAGTPSSPTIMNNVITGNAGCGFGDAIRLFDGSPTIVDNIVSHNTIGECSGGFDGAIVVYGSGAPEIGGNVIVDNDSSGVEFSAGASQPGVVANNVILGNWGAGVSISTSTASALIVQNLIVGNESGIAVNGRVGGPFPVIGENTVAYNNGPQLFLEGTTVGLAVANNIFAGNYGSSPVSCALFSGDATSNPAYANNDLWSQSTPATASNTIVTGTHAGGCTDPVGQNGNISADPRLTPGFQLGAGSAAVDTGTNAARYLAPADLARRPRIVNGRIDMEAFERHRRRSGRHDGRGGARDLSGEPEFQGQAHRGRQHRGPGRHHPRRRAESSGRLVHLGPPPGLRSSTEGESRSPSRRRQSWEMSSNTTQPVAVRAGLHLWAHR